MTTQSLPPTTQPAVKQRRRFWFSSIELLITLCLLFVLSPFVTHQEGLIRSLILSIVFVLAMVGTGGRGRRLWIGISFCVAAIGLRWADHFIQGTASTWLSHLSTIVFLLYVVVHLLRYIHFAIRVDSEVICAAISAYLILGLIWSLNYNLVGRLDPGAFSYSGGPTGSQTMDSFNSFYFSFVALTTIGFGDIVPVSRAARMLVVTETITGMFYMTVLVARLVSLHSALPPKKQDP